MAQYNPNPTPEPQRREEFSVSGAELADKVKELIHESTVRHIVVRQDDHVIVEFPLAAGVVGTLIAPWLAAMGAIGALVAHCTIEVVRSDKPVS
jgi:Domain of unknown function (DUF4342)